MGLHFKEYLPNVAAYKGGKSKEEIAATVAKVYKLSSNENPLGSSPLAMKAVQHNIHSLSEYPSPMDDRFRKALSLFYKEALSSDQFITTNSGVANLELIMRGFLEKGSECIYSSPFFTPYRGFALKMGAKAIDVPLLGDDFSLDVAGILNQVNDQTSLIFITSPNNPTGSYFRKEEVDELVNQIPDHVLLVFDEVYYQYPDAPDYIRALPYVMEGKNVIAVNSFSKAYGLAGLRIGYSYSTEEVAKYLRKFRRPFMLNTLSMEAAIAALDDENFIQKSIALIHKEKSYLYRELDNLEVKYWKTQANFIMIKPEISPADFESHMAIHGVMVRTLEGFGAPDKVRVTIGTREANEAFIRALKKLKRK